MDAECPVNKELQLDRQRRIFDLLQGRLLDAAEDLVSDAEYLSDLAEAVSHAADTVEALEGVEREGIY